MSVSKSIFRMLSTFFSDIFQIICNQSRINNVVVFESFNRKYTDSPKAISEAFHKEYPNVQIIWVVRNVHSSDIPPYSKAIKYNSLKHLYYQATAKIYVDNYVGKYTYKITKRNSFLRRLKREGQYNISIWHGTPLKRLANYNAEDEVFSTSDLFVSGSDYNTRAVLGSFKLNIQTLNVGLPRNDILFNLTFDKKRDIRKKLGIPLDKKFVLFAPTFRDNAKLSSVNLLQTINIPLILDAFSKRFGEEWVMAFRVHPKMADSIIALKDNLYDNVQVFDGNIENDMGNYLATCDALISDYSGSLFDIALIDTPSFIFCEDVEKYKNDRGLIFDLDQMPQSVARNTAELVNNILFFDLKRYSEKRKCFLSAIGDHESGNASNSVAKIIAEKLQCNA